MKCNQVKNLLTQNTRKLTESELRDIEQHLAECSECESAFANYNLLVESIEEKELKPDQADRLKHHILAKLKHEQATNKSVSFREKIFGHLFFKLAVAILVAFTLFWFYISPQKKHLVKKVNVVEKIYPLVAGKFYLIDEKNGSEKLVDKIRIKEKQYIKLKDSMNCKIGFAPERKIICKGSFAAKVSKTAVEFIAGKAEMNFEVKKGRINLELPLYNVRVYGTTLKVYADDKVNEVKVVNGSIEIFDKVNKPLRRLNKGESYKKFVPVKNLKTIIDKTKFKNMFEENRENDIEPEIASETWKNLPAEKIDVKDTDNPNNAIEENNTEIKNLNDAF